MGNHPSSGRSWVRGLAGLLVLASTTVHSGGFYLIEQSVSSMGTAYANGSSGIDDASTIFFNPASMTRLKGKHLSGGVHVLDSDVDFKGTASYNPANPLVQQLGLAGTDIEGKNKTDTDLTEPVPHGGYSHQFNDRIWLGLTLNAPFGLKTDYDDEDWVGRYHAIKSELLTYNINPSIAFKIDEHASVGFGLSALYADGELTNAVDGGLLASIGNNGPIPGVGTDFLDGFAKLTGDDWGFGFNAGGLLQPSENTRLGLSYRSKIDLEIEGDAKISRLTGPLEGFNGKQDAELDITLPNILSLSGFHQFTPKLALMLDVSWFQWSKLDSLVVDLQGGGKTETPLEWDDTFRVSFGGSYRLNDRWLFRAGVAWDESPIPKENLRTPRVPGEDRTWLSLGANFSITKQLNLDVGYAHLFVDDPKVRTDSAYDPTTGSSSGFHLLTGEYDASVNIYSIQLNWKFD